MTKYRRSFLYIVLITAVVLTLSACTTATGGDQAEGKEAFVDGVNIKEHMQHSYATTVGHYPDACARVSDVQQTVEGSSINIMLYVQSPADMMCAQMLTPFEVDILLETGGLAPGEYTVTVNERSPTFMLGG